MIKAKRIYEPTPKKEEQVDLQKVIADAFQSSISKAEKVSTGVSLEIEKENKIIERIMYKIEDKIKAMKIDKSGVTEDVYKQLSSSLNSLGEYLLNIVNNHEHDYLTSEDKDECISIAETMVNEAVDKFDSLIKPFENSFLKVLERKADKEHSHNEFDEIMEEIEENEKELESKIDKKADKKHMHKIGDIENLKDKLEKKADKEHKHDEYATRQELEFIAMQKARGTGGGGHVIQGSGVILAQRSNLNFLGATVTDDPDNNATVVTVTGGGGGASSYEVTQNTHGFINLDWLYFDESDNTFKKAQSNAEATLGARHVVEVVDANTFKVAKDGVHEIANTLDLGEYVLSQDTAGGYTQTLPGDLGDYVLWGMEVVSSTHVSFYTVPAIPVGDTGEGVQSVVAGTGITVDNTDPLNPIINATGGGSGTVTSVAISGSDGLEVDSGSPVTTTGTIALGVNKTAMLSHLNVEDGADVTDATNVASAGAFMKSVDDTDDIIEGTTNLFMSTTEQNKLGYITVTQAVDLDQMETDIAALANGMVYKGNRDASAGTFPGAGVAQTGRFYTVSVAGTVDSVVFNVDDRLVATVDNASATTYAGNWTKLDATDAVTSVFGRPGNVVATNGDYTASQITNVASGGISAVTVQTAIDELDTEKAPKTSPTFATSINGSYLTASEILITDASKNIVSAPVATYPSLSELSYVKGVTSAIQTQLDTKITASSTDTITNKRITPRVGSATSSATPTINTDDVDAYSITALATAITSFTTNLSGTPTDFQKLMIRIKDNGTARAITRGASFEAKGVALPTTTVINKVLTVGFVYDTVSAKWGCIASAQEA